MKSKAKFIPEGHHTATPYLIVRDAVSAIEFYKKAFGATELMRHADTSGKIMHAQIMIGDSPIMIGEQQEIGAPNPQSLPPVSIYLYVEDVDALASQAITAGAKVINPVRDEYYGDRTGGLVDPFGLVWWIATHNEDVPPEELYKRAASTF